MQEPYENFFHENFTKDQDTLIEQSLCKPYEKYFTKILHIFFKQTN